LRRHETVTFDTAASGRVERAASSAALRKLSYFRKRRAGNAFAPPPHVAQMRLLCQYRGRRLHRKRIARLPLGDFPALHPDLPTVQIGAKMPACGGTKGPGMTDVPSCNPHKEEDEGYLAAESGSNIARNPYPKGTIRHEEWRRGWQIKKDETRRDKGEGYLAAEAGQPLAQNPYPRGTIRFAEWRSGWQLRNEETQRAIRLGRDT
jgi:hypothetical protein